MRCETCQGVGRVTYDQHPEPKPEPFGCAFPCPDCGGSGISHCCDGLTACNDPDGIVELATRRSTPFPDSKIIFQGNPK